MAIDERDETESLRRLTAARLNAAAAERKRLEELHGKVWDSLELNWDFEVEGFMAPCVVVRRKADGVRGSVMFQHEPRYYFRFQEDK